MGRTMGEHQEDAAKLQSGYMSAMRSGKTLVMENARLKSEAASHSTDLAIAEGKATNAQQEATEAVARAQAAEAEIEKLKHTYVPQRNAIAMMGRLEAAGFGQPGSPNTLYFMVFAICDEIERLKKETEEAKLIAQGVEEGAAEWEDDCKEAQERVAKLDNALRYIAHVDKTPMYGYQGTQADKDRRGQLPKKPGERWKTPREIVRDTLGEEKASS